ncbi:hypothetical protein DES34_10616 [Brevibacillus brevis]|nr:hypothetical protein DES34_10616 [Brevibacillus brevis]TQK62552.1 hypothetical protein FB479_105336 [Brevibacillus sp. AG162]GEC92600.1 hypothetical protein BBR01nite_49310 [Brevibacillus brevis]VEF87833.1 Uncharacterised protein [Brevibacillus brevis]
MYLAMVHENHYHVRCIKAFQQETKWRSTYEHGYDSEIMAAYSAAS